MKIKRILTVIILIFLCVSIQPAMAGERTFTWDANTESDLAGYRLYQATSSGGYTFGSGWIAEIPAGTETLTYNIVPDGTYYFVLTAFDTSGNESGPSNEVSTAIDDTAPAPPGGLQCN